MNKRGWSTRIVIRYALLQLPGLALLVLILIFAQRWMDIPTWFFWSLVALWVVKDVILFHFTWRAYDWNRQGDIKSMVGAQGIAKDRLAPSGYIRVGSELWQAEVMEGGPPIERGDGIRVQGVRGLTLLVQPDSEERE